MTMDDRGIGLARQTLNGIKMFWHLDESDVKIARLGGLTNLVFRVDHAGEYAAVLIYRAQKAVFEGRKARGDIVRDLGIKSHDYRVERFGRERVRLMAEQLTGGFARFVMRLKASAGWRSEGI